MASIEVQYAIEVLEGIAATVDAGVYNMISKTPVNPLMLDRTAINLLEQAAGTALEPMVTDAGETIGYVAKGVAQAGNGSATEVSTYVNVLTKETIVDAEMIARAPVDIATGETAALTAGETVSEVSAAGTGAGLLGMSVPTAGAAIAPVLGLVAGYGLYNISSEFWDGVASRLMTAGELIMNGRVKALLGVDKKTSFSKNTIEIYKQAFLEAGFFDDEYNIPVYSEQGEVAFSSTLKPSELLTPLIRNMQHATYEGEDFEYLQDYMDNYETYLKERQPDLSKSMSYIFSYDDTGGFPSGTNGVFRVQTTLFNDTPPSTIDLAAIPVNTLGIFSCSVTASKAQDVPAIHVGTSIMEGGLVRQPYYNYHGLHHPNESHVQIGGINITGSPSDRLQPDATLPTEDPFDQTYPTWQPNITIQNEEYYPASMPTDQNTQQPSQSGDNDKDEQEDIIGSILFNPDPVPKPKPKPEPDPQPEPEQDTDTDTPTPVPDPLDPNPEPDPSDPSPTLPIISGIHASKMCTIYNPTDAEVDDLGAFLWVDNVIEQIRLIFQDPMDGIISLHKIYAPPVTGSRKDIILGYIDSGVDALEVTNQFTTVSCGSVTIGRKFGNVTDYPPYTQAHIYLPFIGIEEIDVAEIMGGTVRVQYRVDAYTGTCVAQIFVTRSPDMLTEQMLYTFSGNASQTVPLTSANFTGLVSSLVSIAGGAATAGAGGALLAAGRGLTSHMASVSHSGSISANAGIMGPRIPYIILTRPQGYDANGYNSIYGYPANTTRYLSNCSGFVRVKDVLYRGDGTEEEKAEIVSLMKNGVIV